MGLLSNSYFAFFLIVALGFILGNVKIKGISLDVSAVIFVALIFGHYGVQVPVDFQYIGLVLFIFTIAIQAGPGFVQSFRKQGSSLITLTLILILSALFSSILLSKLFNVDPILGIGLLSGALTSTPGLAVAIDSTNSTLASIGYGIAYPFGVLGVILFVRLYPKFTRVNLAREEEKINKEVLTEYPEIYSKQYIVENQNILGKSLKELNIRSMTGASISRVSKESLTMAPTPDTILEKGNLIRAVGTNEAHEKIRLLIGPVTKKEIPMSENFVVESVLVTNKKLVNKSIAELNLIASYGATITRIRRSGIDISPTPDIHIRFGDKLLLACDKDRIKEVVQLLGNEGEKLSDTDFFPIAAGIVLGILVGKIQIAFSDKFVFSPGLTGGILIVGLVLSNLGKTGPIVWTMSEAANQLLRQLGLLFFFTSVGTQAGANLVETYNEYGIKLFLIGAIITILPMFITGLVSHFFLKVNIFTFLGGLTGGMTSTPGLAAIDSMSKTNTAQLAYATVYPVALVLIILAIQVLSYLI